MGTEKDLEQRLRRYAQTKNILFLKFTSPGSSGWPDRLVISPLGRMFFIEFKSPLRGRLSALQQATHSILRAHNVEVYVVDSFTQGKSIIDSHCLD